MARACNTQGGNKETTKKFGYNLNGKDNLKTLE